VWDAQIIGGDPHPVLEAREVDRQMVYRLGPRPARANDATEDQKRKNEY
jgi:hypothetical protein